MSQNLWLQCPWTAPLIVLNNEYLFFQVEWQTLTTVGATTVLSWCQGEPVNVGGYITPTDFQAGVPKTWYPLANVAGTANAPGWFGALQDGGSVSRYGPIYGWNMGSNPLVPSGVYMRARAGASAVGHENQPTSYIESAAGPIKGTDTTATGAGDSWITPTPYTGTFVAGNWFLNIGQQSGQGGQTTSLRFRVWASQFADGSSARALTTATVVTPSLGPLGSAALYQFNAVWAAPAITLTNEYLFFQYEAYLTTSGNQAAILGPLQAITTAIVSSAWSAINDLGTADLAPAVTFAADLTVIPLVINDLGTANLAPAVTFASDLTVTKTPVPATPIHIQGGGTDNGTTPTSSISVTLGNPVGLGNTIIIYFGLNNVTGTISDDKGNVYTYLPIDNAAGPGGTFRVQTAYCINITNGPTTFTLTTSKPAMYEAMTVDEFSGVASFDTSTTQNGGVTTFPTGNITTSGPNELLYTDAWATNSGPLSVGAPFAFLQFAGSQNNNACAFYVQPTPATIQAVWTSPSNSGGGTARIVAFNPVVVIPPTDLAGDLAPAVSLAGDLTVIPPIGLAGNLAPSITFAADLTFQPVVYVDFAGNLGGEGVGSLYGKGPYGRGPYGGLDAITPIFAADLSIVAASFYGDLAPIVTFAGGLSLNQPLKGDFAPVITFKGDLDIVGTVYFAGDLAPVISFGGDLTGTFGLAGGDLAPAIAFSGALTITPATEFAGNFAPQVTFAADLTVIIVKELAGNLQPQVVFSGDLSLITALAGDLPLQVALGALLGLDLPLEGGLSLTVDFAGSELTAGPLWAESTPCPPTMWTPVEPCDPVDWEELELCNG